MRSFIKSVRFQAMVLVAGLVGTACAAAHDDTSDEDQSTGAATEAAGVWATSDWADRSTWYTTTQGSHLLDYGVFKALERDTDTTKFASRSNLEPMGFVYGPKGDTTLSHDGLPLGVVKDTVKAASDTTAKDYLGFTCSACHTGELIVKGKRLLVDGGQSFLEYERFVQSLQSSLTATAADPAKLQRFCTSLGDAAHCNDRLSASRDRIAAMNGRNVVKGAKDGPGRLDAISRILNEVFAGQLGGETAQPVQVPVSIPYVWDAPRLYCVQTDCLAKNSMQRNIGETLGVFGHVKINLTATGATVDASAKMESLYNLEHSLVSLKSPKWNTEVFGSLDLSKRNRGKDIFAATCKSCHAEPYADTAASNFIAEPSPMAPATLQLWKVAMVPFAEIGTDPLFIEKHNARMVQSPQLTAFFDGLLAQGVAAAIQQPVDSDAVKGAVGAQIMQMVQGGLRKDDGSIASIAMLGAVTAAIEHTKLPDFAATSKVGQSVGGDPGKALAAAEFFRNGGGPTDFGSYRARPLNGIAFTGPFGHNGAWPTLRDVLTAEDARPKTFPVRPRTFDPSNVGIDITGDAKSGEFVFDTSLPGNDNRGHQKGVDLSDADKDALIEYLKSI